MDLLISPKIRGWKSSKNFFSFFGLLIFYFVVKIDTTNQLTQQEFI